MDAVPDHAPKPSTTQMAKFLTRVLEPSELPDAANGDGVAMERVGSLGESVPELLVVENTNKVRRAVLW